MRPYLVTGLHCCPSNFWPTLLQSMVSKSVCVTHKGRDLQLICSSYPQLKHFLWFSWPARVIVLGHCQLRALGPFQINHSSGTGVAQSCFYGKVLTVGMAPGPSTEGRCHLGPFAFKRYQFCQLAICFLKLEALPTQWKISPLQTLQSLQHQGLLEASTPHPAGRKQLGERPPATQGDTLSFSWRQVRL